MSPPSPKKLAVMAFLFHAPGIRILYGYRLSRALFIENIIAALATIIAIVASAILSSSEHRVLRSILAFLIGHFAWSTILAIRVFRTRSDRARRVVHAHFM